MADFDELKKMVYAGKARAVRDLVLKALENGAAPIDILEQGLLPGMNEIGERFKISEVYVPEVLMAVRAMNIGLSILRSAVNQDKNETYGVAVVGTVKGDLHDIGKNLVKMMLESKGIAVIDLGVDVPAMRFVEEAKRSGADLICCSALLTTTMKEMAEVVRCAQTAGIRDHVRIMVGGAPVTQEFCDTIGADCFTPDAASAADAAYAYLTGRK